MKDAIRSLDRRFAALRPLLQQPRPPKGWVRAVRDALGMTTQQLALRIGVSQPRITELEKAEVSGNISLKSLERTAEALGCRVVYALVPERPLAETVRAQAERAADRQLAIVSHTMQLEDQAVRDETVRKEQRARIIDRLMQKPARLWDEK
jgi:predicted DNA-binding mobile mystery protein A